MKATFEKIINWIFVSSANPTNASLTIIGSITAFIGFVPSVVLAHFNIDMTSVNAIITDIGNGVTAFLTFVGACIATYGLLRKIWLSIVPHPVTTPPAAK